MFLVSLYSSIMWWTPVCCLVQDNNEVSDNECATAKFFLIVFV